MILHLNQYFSPVVFSRSECTFRGERLSLVLPGFAYAMTLIAMSVGMTIGLAQENRTGHVEDSTDQWHRHKISKLFHGEGGTLADLDADGHCDVVSGYQVFFGPDFKQTAKLFDSNPYNINGYSEYFFDFHYDIDSDGDQDILVVGFPGAASHWYRNPGKDTARRGLWERFTVLEVTDNESPMFEDITGDGRPELLCCNGGHFGYAEIPANPTDAWVFRAVSDSGPYQRFTHGIGFGDVNDDGYKDMLSKDGWWQNPGLDGANPADKAWAFHPVGFSGPGGAQMHAVDLDGDGVTEVITSLAAHAYGLAVYKKSKGESDYRWDRIDVMTDRMETSPTGLAISQLHAVAVADIDGDGKLDILTGKRFWAHNGNDPGENELPMLVWFKPIALSGGLKFEPHVIDQDSGVGTQVTVEDADADGKLDILCSSKRGVVLLTHRALLSASKNATEKTSDDANASSTLLHERDKQGTVAESLIAITDDFGGLRPAWSSTESMNFDFETGDLRDWQAFGGAFFNQPVQGDTVAARGKGEVSGQQGEYWIGTSEIGTDVAMGTMTSKPFRVTKPFLSFLIGGGESALTRLEIVDSQTQKVLHTEHGRNSDTMLRVVIESKEWNGKAIEVRLVDESREGWGHIQFDDLRLHDARPNL